MVEAQAQINDETHIKGIPWSQLKLKLVDPGFDAEAFRVSNSVSVID